MSSNSVVTEPVDLSLYQDLYPVYYNSIQATSLVEMLLYGGYLAIFYKCIKVLNIIRRQRNATYKIQMPYLYCALVMLFLITTINLVTTVFCSFKQIYYVDSNNELAYLPTGFVLARNLYPGIFMLKTILFVIAILISDSVLVFRCYAVFNRRFKVTLFPIMAFLADIAVGCLMISDTAYMFQSYVSSTVMNYGSVSELIVGDTYYPSRLGLFSITLALNVMCTSLITFRILKIQRQAHHHSPRSGHVRNTVLTIIESGFIYSTWIAILLGTSFSSSGAYVFFEDTTIQIVAITFSIIISRMGRDIGTGDSQVQNRGTGRSSTSKHIHTGAFPSAAPANVSDKYTSSQAVQVVISHDVWHEEDIELGSHDHSSLQTITLSVHDDRVKSDL